MDILQSLQGILSGIGGGQNNNQAQGGQTQAQASAPASGFDWSGLQQLFGPAALGGLAGALFGGGRGSIGGMLKGALLAGGGKMLWDKYKDKIRQANADNPEYSKSPAPADQRATRMIRALVYAARADGHIDEKEQQAIDTQVKQMNLGYQGQNLVRHAMSEAIDPAKIAEGVTDEEEALQLFTISCAVLNVDNFMERSYLDGLAAALKIPEEVRNDFLAKIKEQVAQATTAAH